MKGGWFITGTDTAVGKTVVTEILLGGLRRRGYRAAGMKPVASGSRSTATGLRNEDVERLVAASSVPVEYGEINSYSFAPAIAPHIAAAQAGVEIQLPTIERQFERLSHKADWIVVEGAGGWYVPLNKANTLAHLAQAISLPVILVVGIRLGCINHALLSARAIRADNLRLAGWVANHAVPAHVADETIAAIDQRIEAPCLGRVPFCGESERSVYGDVILDRLLPERSLR